MKFSIILPVKGTFSNNTQMFFERLCPYLQHTSVCLIYYHKSAADSEKLLPDMKILNVVSNSPTYVPTIPKIFWPEISAMPEISTDFEPHTIIEFHIYGFILPILKAILGKNVAKTLQKFYQYEKSVQTDVFKNFKLKLLRNFSPTHNQTLFWFFVFLIVGSIIPIPNRLWD